jgi:hypothetical protein
MLRSDAEKFKKFFQKLKITLNGMVSRKNRSLSVCCVTSPLIYRLNFWYPNCEKILEVFGCNRIDPSIDLSRIRIFSQTIIVVWCRFLRVFIGEKCLGYAWREFESLPGYHFKILFYRVRNNWECFLWCQRLGSFWYCRLSALCFRFNEGKLKETVKRNEIKWTDKKTLSHDFFIAKNNVRIFTTNDKN